MSVTGKADKDVLSDLPSILEQRFGRRRFLRIPKPWLQRVEGNFKGRGCIYKCVVSKEVCVSDIPSSEFIELDAGKVFLGVNVTLDVKG